MLTKIKKALSKTRPEFDSWVESSENELCDFFYGLTGQELVNLEFDLFFSDTIQTSQLYRDYHQHRNTSHPFTLFLMLLGVAAEKMAETGSHSFAKILVTDLPVSATKFRIRAINEFSQVEDLRTSFSAKLPLVLSHLDNSRTIHADEPVRPIVDVLVFFLQRVNSTLRGKEYKAARDRIIEQLKDADLHTRYPFLRHQILTDLIDGKDPFAIYPSPIAKGCLHPSTAIKLLFSKINETYYSHPEIDHTNKRLWGHTIQYILNHVLVRGRGDFTKSSGKISEDDKVMLYCFYNLKMHFFSSYAVFKSVLESLGDFFRLAEYKPVFIDLGCGPMTSGLAIADLIHETHGNPITMSYVGIDISDAMLKKAKEFSKLTIFSDDCSFDFMNNWRELSPKKLERITGKNNPIIFNASYLFASESLEESDLASYVNDVVKTHSNVYFIFQNPNRHDRNEKYKSFKKLIKFEQKVFAAENIRYKSASKENNEDVEYEILRILKP